MVETDFRQDVLEAGTPFHIPATVPLVPVDDLDAITGPTESDGQVGEGILSRLRFLVLDDLLGARLSHINDCFTFQMAAADLDRACCQQMGGHGGQGAEHAEDEEATGTGWHSGAAHD